MIVMKKVYVCDACRFIFESADFVSQCPDCGKFAVRDANDREITEFEERTPDIWEEDNDQQ